MAYALNICTQIFRYVWDKGDCLKALHHLFLLSQGGFIMLIARFSWIGPASAAFYTGVVARVGKGLAWSSSALVNTRTSQCCL